MRPPNLPILSVCFLALFTFPASSVPQVVRLDIVKQGDFFNLYWPSSIIDATLEFSTELNPDSWDTLDLAPNLVDDRWKVTLPDFDGSAFYRLRYQDAPVVDGFTTQRIHGFNVLVNDDDAASHASGLQTAIDELATQLSAIAALDLNADVLAKIRGFKIFLVWNVRSDGAAWYHPSQQWLIDNGRDPAKALSVEIANATNFVNWSRQNQPWMVFHELTHAYHHQVLGYGHAPTIAAFQNATNTGIYDSVLYNPGSGQSNFTRPAYALTNETEYIAEISEAFFGENDFYPFTRTDLETHDPTGYALMLDVWQVNASTAVDRHP